MQRPIVHSKIMLGRIASEATPNDAHIAADLVDTLEANLERCVGMAANMIGENKRIIAVRDGNRTLLMYNPEILEQRMPYETEEGCLSLDGTRSATRYRKIKLRFLDQDFVCRTQAFSGFTAQIIQHEVDHCNGVII